MNLRQTMIAIALVLVATHLVWAQDRFFDSNGVRIRYIVEGRGEPLVLLHGQGAGLQPVWINTGVVKDLAGSYMVIALDSRGAGLSDKPHEPSKYGEELGLDIIRLLDHLRIQKTHIVGYSLGGLVVHQLIATHPERFQSAILVAGSAPSAWTHEDEQRVAREGAEIARDGVSRSQQIRNAAPGTPPPTDEDIRRQAEAMEKAGRDKVAEGAIHSSRGRIVVAPQASAAIPVPTLGIVGSLDPAQTGLKDLATRLPGMRVVVVEGATHGPGERGIIRQSEFLERVRKFLDAHRTS